MNSRVAGLVAGYVLDQLLGDPRRGHPVAAFGQVAGALESRIYADRLGRGVLFTAVLTGAGAGIAAVVEHRLAARPLSHAALTAATTWAVLGGRTLGREATMVHDLLASGDLPGARVRLTHLVGRDPSALDEGEVARAVVESVAENTSDAVVAPLIWGGCLGLPGLVGYRIVNTLDAMVGHHNDRYERFGKAAARLDDLVNLGPARLSALLTAVGSGRPRPTLRAWREFARRHPSPNAGQVESAFAGALGVRLGGTNVYGDRIEHRPELGTGRPPEINDISRAVRLAERVDIGALVVAVSTAAWPTLRRRLRS